VVEALWNEAMFDIKYHARHASAIVIDDPPVSRSR
jgi:hypothetical protein